MYCEKCCRIIDTLPCPACKGRKARDPRPDDPCFLTEQDFLPSGVLEDILNQNGIPFLKKNVLGAGLAIKVGPMLDRSRFYVAYELLPRAQEIVEELFSDPDKEQEGAAEEMNHSDH